MEKFLPIAALMCDSIIGDPRSSLHPVVLIGNLITFFERMLLKQKHSSLSKKLCGVVLVCLVLLITYSSVWAIMQLLYGFNEIAAFIGGALLLSFTISPHSLAEAGQEIRGYLVAGDLGNARYKVGWIVGRDTESLDTPEITRATVETIAENIVDGIISPLFYFAIGGVPLAFLYRAVNTLDSMVGYKNEKYADFGMCAARVDDIFNYIPARITAIILVVAAGLLAFDIKGAIYAIWHDAAKHPSPNSGYAEAGVAGALGVQLGGLNYYGGVRSQRAHMGQPKHQLAPEHIKNTIYIMYLATIIFVALAILVPVWR